MKIISNIVGGVIESEDFEDIVKHLNDGRYIIDITEAEKSVTNMMNYYRGPVLKDIGDHMGESDMNYLHNLIRGMYGFKINLDGEDMPISTANYTYAMWKEFLNTTIREQRMLGATIRDPKQAGYEDY